MGGPSGTTVAVSEQVDQLKKKKKKQMQLECDGRRLLTFSPLFSYQMLGRKKRGRQESALSGETWALTQPLSNPIAALARRNVNVMRICSFFNLQIANGAFQERQQSEAQRCFKLLGSSDCNCIVQMSTHFVNCLPLSP